MAAAVAFEGSIRIEFELEGGSEYDARTVADVLFELSPRHPQFAAIRLEELVEAAIIARIERDGGGPVKISKIEFNRVEGAPDLAPCHCENAAHFNAPAGVTVLNGPKHAYGMGHGADELATVETVRGPFVLCVSCREEGHNPAYVLAPAQA